MSEAAQSHVPPGVTSEVGRLRTVMLHRPGPELQRLTPRNNDKLLFDGIPWVSRAQEEHDAFAEALRSRGVEVLYLTELLVETLAAEAARAHAIEAVTGWKAVLASFLVLFAAEWGDLSQLLTISLVAKYENPVSVFTGALAALLAVSGLAVVAGRGLLRVISLHVLHYAGAGVCLLLAAVTAYELLA